ncbi:uncharacterized protein LOC132751875 [Ruditapes philippinarum]|uniref:uncharacterized protein LOC132751875 n=1 Tax=Ruditapes philippinarum TaxID=129788 RepID=UPI00295A7C02|nr:uncharacterized protein LOC132751875 [Ruditapes philippinarum]
MGNCNGNEKLIDELADHVGALYDNLKVILPATNDLVDVINSIPIGNLPHAFVTDTSTIQMNVEHIVELINAINHCVDVQATWIAIRLQPDIFRNLLDVTISSEEKTWPTTADELKADLKKTRQCLEDVQKNTDRYITDVETIKVQVKMGGLVVSH